MSDAPIRPAQQDAVQRQDQALLLGLSNLIRCEIQLPVAAMKLAQMIAIDRLHVAPDALPKLFQKRQAPGIAARDLEIDNRGGAVGAHQDVLGLAEIVVANASIVDRLEHRVESGIKVFVGPS